MKNFYSLMVFSLVVLLGMTGCEKEEMNHTRVTPVNNLYAPQNNAFFNLSPRSSVTFEWEAAKAEDNGVVLYEVVFDKEDGDFSNPVYVIPSDGKGLQRSLSMTYAELSRIAGMAGIQPEASGKLKWTVWSSKGVNVQSSPVSHIIEVERPAGFPAPAEAFISGTATEGGDVLADAIPMKQVSGGIFEVYTSLKAGEYFISERNNGEPVTYSVSGDKLVSGGTTEVSGDEKVYRIRVDFTAATTGITEIQSVGLWFAPDDKFLFELPYVGNGVWEIKDAQITFKQEDWGRDERYKFRFKTTSADGSEADEWFGSSNRDNNRPTSTSPASYWFMTPVSSDRWDNSFKFADAVDNNTNDVQVIFNTTVPAYTHKVTPK